MSLRDIKITQPTFTCTVPSTKKKVKFRAFNVGDEKALLMAAESKDTQQMVNTIKDVLTNCVDGINVDLLAPFDIEYLFIKLRTISVGETASIGMACGTCNHQNKVDVPLDDIEVVFPPGHEKIVRITPTLGFEMKYPDLNETGDVDPKDPDSIMRVVAASIKVVFNEDDVIDVTNEPREDIIALLEQLPAKQFQDVQNFFATMPKLQKEISFKCKNCGTENNTTLEGLADFF